MATISKPELRDALLRLGELAAAEGGQVEPADRDGAWRRVQRHLQPGRGLKARYAFDDLWEDLHGQT